MEVIPIYGNEKERRQATEKELNSVQEEILRASNPTNPESEENPREGILEFKKVSIHSRSV